MNYPLKTLSQLPVVLKAFRKTHNLTQAAVAEKLGVTQQSYARFENKPASATLERLFLVLRLLDVEISLNQTNAVPAVSPETPATAAQTPGPVNSKANSVGATGGAKPAMPKAMLRLKKLGRIGASRAKKESW